MAKIEVTTVKIQFIGGWMGDPDIGHHYFASGTTSIGNSTILFKDVQLTKEEESEMEALFQKIADRLYKK